MDDKEKDIQELLNIAKGLEEDDVSKIKSIAIGIDLARKDDASKNKDAA